jgi:Ca-activated chloride channel family protein
LNGESYFRMLFLQPQYFKLFYLVLALVPLWLYFIITKHRTRAGLGDRRAVKRISRLSPFGKEVGRYLLINVVLVALVFALTRPQTIREKNVVFPQKMDVIFLLDVSPSMRAGDIPPSRLERALDVIASFARKKMPHDRIALVSFSSGSLILSYLTQDANNIVYYLNYLKENPPLSHGTNIGRAILNGIDVVSREPDLNQPGAQSKRIFILVSDGEDHGGELDAALFKVSKLGIRIHAIGIGSREGAPIPLGVQNGKVMYVEDDRGQRIITRFDESTLQRVAHETGGSMYRSFTGEELGGFFSKIVSKERGIDSYKQTLEYEELYPKLLWTAFGAFLVALLL